MSSKIEVGSRVAYSVQWLRSISASHDEIAHARGVVTKITKYSSRLILAEVDWHTADLPKKVLVANLAKVSPNTKFCQC